jgi:hypothetical protein
VKIPKEAWRKDKARAYGLPCLSLDNHIRARNDHRIIKNLTSAMELMDYKSSNSNRWCAKLAIVVTHLQ